ncbi:MAG: hypothetical protein EF813_09265 [Methanosarcinales archaeon]|nr:MAG: hypothetical protein EF813_09265 [Methanosarcinales archaeon]
MQEEFFREEVAGDKMSAPGEVHTNLLVKVQPAERLTAVELSPARWQVTGCYDACGIGGRIEEALGPEYNSHIRMRVKDGCKTRLIPYLIDKRDVSSEESGAGTLQVGFWDGVHRDFKTTTPTGGAP